MGIVRFALRFPHTFYVLAALIVFLGDHRHPHDADRHLPRDQHSGGDGDLELHRPVSTPEMEQRVTTYSQYAISSNVNGIKNIEAQTLRRPVGPEDLLPAGRQSRPRHLADRLGDERHPRADAARHPAADHRAVQRLERAGAADQPHLRHAQRAAALRLRHLRLRQQLAPVHGVTFPTPAGGKYRQIMVDIDPHKLLAKGLTPARRRQRRQRAEPDAAVRHGEDRRHAVHRPHQRHAGHRSTSSTTSRSRS